MKNVHNKAFKRDSCRVPFLVCGDFCGESGLRKVGLSGIHPLTQRYASRRKNGARIQNQHG
ncbi:TPA: DUF3265 domain-containing protein [Vibrio parahaemolyticus]